MRTFWNFFSPGQLVFGRNALQELPANAARRGWRRIVVLTDPHLAALPMLGQVVDGLASGNIHASVFDQGEAEPSLDCVQKAITYARGEAPDAVLGLGGGSNLDLAKLTAIGCAHGEALTHYFGEDSIPGPVLPIVCIPTTAGTGSEVSGSAVVTDLAAGTKVGVMSNYLRPTLSLVDPCLTLTCPHKVTADSGLDALTHAIEAFCAVDNEVFPLPAGTKSIYQGRHPLGMLLAEKAIGLIGHYLPLVLEQPDHLIAREEMSLAALLAGLAFSNIGVALVHAMEYPLGVAVHCSHGGGNALLLPHVMRFNLPVRKAEYAQIARLLGRSTHGMDPDAAAEQAVQAVQELLALAQIPQRLEELGLRREQIPDLATKAFGVQRLLRVNPRFPTREQIEEIYQQAY